MFLETPTYRRTAALFRAIATENDKIKGQTPKFEALHRIALHLGALAGDENAGQAQEMFTSGLSILENSARECPKVADAIAYGVDALLLAMTSMLLPQAMRMSAAEASRMRPLAQVNEAKANAIDCAQTIAEELWQADESQIIRIGEMADKVYRVLIEYGYTASLPGTPDRIKEWIKPVAPDYARKGGRRRKTP